MDKRKRRYTKNSKKIPKMSNSKSFVGRRSYSGLSLGISREAIGYLSGKEGGFKERYEE